MSKGFVARPKALNCPQCGAAIELRAMGAAAAVVCSYCHSTIDATNENLRVIARWKEQVKVEPAIPLGSRGKLRGTVWEAIGFQVRGIQVEGTNYYWREYVLWNPYQGFRYLSEYDGHWNFITPLPALPTPATFKVQGMSYGGETFRHFQTAHAHTWFVLGEFPWMVQVGESVTTADYVAPPKMLSSEATEDEVTWSLGEYVEGAEIWQAFGIKTPLLPVAGIYSNQPSPYTGRVKANWKLFALSAAALMALMLFFAATARRQTVLDKAYQSANVVGEKSFVTEVFELPGQRDNVSIDIETDLQNSWAYFSMALINDDTGEAFDFGREVSYYTGTDSDGRWTEGTRVEDVVLPSIPGGRYYLRVEPELDPARVGPGSTINYSIKVVRGVPYYLRYFLAMLLLAIPAVWISLRSAAFEGKRWSESDTGSGSGGDDE